MGVYRVFNGRTARLGMQLSSEHTESSDQFDPHEEEKSPTTVPGSHRLAYIEGDPFSFGQAMPAICRTTSSGHVACSRAFSDGSRSTLIPAFSHNRRSIFSICVFSCSASRLICRSR